VGAGAGTVLVMRTVHALATAGGSRGGVAARDGVRDVVAGRPLSQAAAGRGPPEIGGFPGTPDRYGLAGL
jgi:hypothetical protein